MIVHNPEERINAGRILEEKVQEIESHERHVFNPAISEFVAMMNQVDELNELKAKIIEQQMLEGKTAEERRDSLEAVDKISQITKLADKKAEIKRKQAVSNIRKAVLEQAPDIAARTFEMDDDSFAAFMEKYAEDHHDSITHEFLLQNLAFEQERQAIYKQAQREFELLPFSERAKQYALAAKEAVGEYAEEFTSDPVGRSLSLAGDTLYFTADMLAPGGIDPAAQYLRGETSGAEAFATWGVALGVESASGYVGGKALRAGRKIGKALAKSGGKLHKIVIEKIARKTEFVTREKRWMQLASEGKLSKQITETIRRTGGKRVYDRHGLELAHRPGKPAAQGYDYRDALPKLKPIHRNQHRFYDEKPGGKIELRVTPHGKNRMTEPGVNGFKKLCEIETEVVRKKK